MQLFQFLTGEKESLEKMESFPVCPATPSNKAGICSPQVTGEVLVLNLRKSKINISVSIYLSKIIS